MWRIYIDKTVNINYCFGDNSVNENMPKVVNTEEKKYLIMKSAVKEFAAFGFERANMNTIAKRIDLGRTAFYSYFKDKREVLDYAVDYLLELIGSDYEQACENMFLTPTEKINFLFRKFLTDILAERDIVTVLLEVLLVNDEDFAEQRKKILVRLNGIKRLLAKILKLGMQTGEMKRLDPNSMAHTLLMVLISVLYSINTFSSESVKNTVDSVSLLLTGLKETD